LSPPAKREVRRVDFEESTEFAFKEFLVAQTFEPGHVLLAGGEPVF
jgi:hypothetical protein